jgi:hypothetical protein
METLRGHFRRKNFQELAAKRAEVGQEVTALWTISISGLQWTGVSAVFTRVEHITAHSIHADQILNLCKEICCHMIYLGILMYTNIKHAMLET